jgi:hypothetical protein
MKKILLLGNTLNQGTARGNKTFVYCVSLPVSQTVLIVMNSPLGNLGIGTRTLKVNRKRDP